MKPQVVLPKVVLVDEDLALLENLQEFFHQSHLDSAAFREPQQYLELSPDESIGCVVADLVMPNMTGMEFLRQMRLQGDFKPVIFLTGHGTIATAVEAMRYGAMDFLEKPTEHQQLLASVLRAIAYDSRRQQDNRSKDELQMRLDSLTMRETQIMELIASGLPSKQIATRLGISIKTVEVHRSNITKKLGVRSLAELVQRLTQHRLTGKG